MAIQAKSHGHSAPCLYVMGGTMGSRRLLRASAISIAVSCALVTVLPSAVSAPLSSNGRTASAAGSMARGTSLDVGFTVTALASHPLSNRLIALSSDGYRYAVIDTPSRIVQFTPTLPFKASDLAPTSSGHGLYVVGDRSAIVDTASGKYPEYWPVRGWSVSVDSSYRWVFIAGPEGLAVVDTQARGIVAQTTPRLNVSAVLALPDGEGAYVALAQDSERARVRRYSTTLTPSGPTVRAGNWVVAMAYEPTKRVLFTANWVSNNVTAISSRSNRVLATIPTPTNPRDLALSEDGSRLYVLTLPNARPTTGLILEVNTSTYRVTRKIVVPIPGDHMELAASGKEAFVSSANSTRIYVVPLP